MKFWIRLLENTFDTVALLAKKLVSADYSFICFCDEKRFFFKSKMGKSDDDIDRIIEDILLSSLSAAEVATHKGSILVASAPIITPEGFLIGFLGISTSQLTQTDEQQLNVLKMLASLITDHLETRLGLRKTLRMYDDRLHMLVHDLKNPMTTISLQSELMCRLPGADERTVLVAGKINRQAKLMIDRLNFILSAARREKYFF